MADPIQTLARLRQQHEEATKEAARCEGELRGVLDRLRKDYRVEGLDAAEALLLQEEAKVAKMKAHLGRMVEKIEEDHGQRG